MGARIFLKICTTRQTTTCYQNSLGIILRKSLGKDLQDIRVENVILAIILITIISVSCGIYWGGYIFECKAVRDHNHNPLE